MSDLGKKRKAEDVEETAPKVDSSNSDINICGSSVTSTTDATKSKAKRARQASVCRLSKEELNELTTRIISTLQVDGPQTLHSITDTLEASQVYVARVLDVLLSTPIVAVSKNSKQEIVYRYSYTLFACMHLH